MTEEVKENGGGITAASAEANKGGRNARAGKNGLKVAMGGIAIGAAIGAALFFWPNSESTLNTPESKTSMSGAQFDAKDIAPDAKVNPHYKKLLEVDQKKRAEESKKRGETSMAINPAESTDDIGEEAMRRLSKLELTMNRLKEENASLRNQMQEQVVMRRSDGKDAPSIDFYVIDGQVYADKKVFNARIKHSDQIVQGILKSKIFPEADVVSVTLDEGNNDQAAPDGQYGNMSYNTAYADKGYANNKGVMQGQSNTANIPEVAAVRAGDMIYATLDMTVNSDVQGPIVATLQAGEFAGAKVLGSFTKKGDYLVLEFNSMTLPDDRFVKISGIAVDPLLRTVAMADEIDRHIPSKLLAVFGAAWLQGIGEAYMKKGSLNTVGGTAGDAVIEKSALDTSEDIAVAGLAKVGVALANMITPYASRPDTVIKYAQSGLAILFTEPVITTSSKR